MSDASDVTGGGTPPVTADLAAWAVGTGWDDLPERVRHEATRALVNWVGCTLGGAREPSVEIALAHLLRFSGPRHAGVLGRAERLDALSAAFINGLSSSVHSFNDTHFATVTHPTSPTAAALLALADIRPMSGREFLLALLLGNEVQCRVASMIAAPPAVCHVGVSTVGVTGVIGAAVAAGRALGLDAGQMAGAIGLAANQAAGLREAHATMASHVTPAHSARCGLEAALLAKAGLQSSATMLEGPKGYAAVFSTGPSWMAAVGGLGSRWEALAVSYKPYPCGFVIHPVIDACLALAPEIGGDPSCVTRIEVEGASLLALLTDRPHPIDRRQGLVSLQHWAAVALAEGAASLPQGGEDRLADPALCDLRDRITVYVDPTLGTEAARIRVSLTDGRVLEHSVAHCTGSVGRPMTDAELSAKFLAQASPALDSEEAGSLLARAWNLIGAPDAAAALAGVGQ